jgi:hypothetical protein
MMYNVMSLFYVHISQPSENSLLSYILFEVSMAMCVHMVVD